MADDQFLRLVLKDQAAFQFIHLKGTVASYVFFAIMYDAEEEIGTGT
jgi:hypothetical protein